MYFGLLAALRQLIVYCRFSFNVAYLTIWNSWPVVFCSPTSSEVRQSGVETFSSSIDVDFSLALLSEVLFNPRTSVRSGPYYISSSSAGLYFLYGANLLFCNEFRMALAKPACLRSSLCP